MAKRPHPIGLSSAAAIIFVAALIFLPIGAVLIGADGAAILPTKADLAALRFTLLQAALSALLSVGLAIPLARALARRQFSGRKALLLVMGAPFILPVIVAALGFVAVYGRNGWISSAFGAAGLPPISVYGLHGVVMAHVFFNLPLATRLVLQGWQSVPRAHLRLAESLNFSAAEVNRTIERPLLAQIVPGALALVFLICSTSFAVVLVLGGGPRATTIELAIYQAFRFEFDIAHAGSLAIVQLIVGLIAGGAAYALRARLFAEAAPEGAGLVPAPRSGLLLWQDRAIIAAGALFLLAPIAAVAIAGAAGLGALSASVWAAAARSILVAFFAMLIVLAAALPLARMAARSALGPMAEGLSFLYLSISPLVIGVGLFIALNPFTDPVALALPITALVNAALALPFVVQALLPKMRQVELSYGKLADNLGLGGWHRWRWLILPQLRGPIGFSAGLSAALSAGDLGVIALFADPEKPTLPLMIYQLRGAYKTDAAQAAALLLAVMALALFWILDRGGRHAEH